MSAVRGQDCEFIYAGLQCAGKGACIYGRIFGSAAYNYRRQTFRPRELARRTSKRLIGLWWKQRPSGDSLIGLTRSTGGATKLIYLQYYTTSRSVGLSGSILSEELLLFRRTSSEIDQTGSLEWGVSGKGRLEATASELRVLWLNVGFPLRRSVVQSC